ncbi:MAG: alpha/beta hydrolase [Planctomycetota bacterium]
MRTHLGMTSAVLAALFLVVTPCAGESYDAAVPTPTHSEIRYGEHERHVMDAWLAKGDSPRPLAFVIHGGGWKGGSKERVQRFVNVQQLLNNGISVVAINYRLITKEQSIANSKTINFDKKPPVHAPLYDAARALQFARNKAEEWNINPDRIGAAGGSAGACTSLWLAFHDDLAVKDRDAPVSKQSSRLYCAAVIGAQTTLDPKQMKAWTPNSKYGGHAFGLNNFAMFLKNRDKILPWIEKYSPYHQVSKGDPPVYLTYNRPPAIGQAEKDPTHTANFGVKLQEHCKANGIPCELNYPGAKNVKHDSITAFLITTLLAN